MRLWQMTGIALGAFFAIPASVALTGGMFGQRCAKAFPSDQHEQERCVYEMVKGLRNYPSEVRP